ncbi:hypothetical protein VSX64_15750 [Aurantimonas sp. C2-6-R+9]|uniref:hypothetical protein n=1 Tax=unclassified Aurantimonas TaxID=2638230 RepID=UPI002E1729AB|nr:MULTISPECIES: hypothetical protein [unclassified Aurantimonas]MEC5289151.1 hypothetical protein [Aurantimonas sp. C2-3-R2]MEC5382322.1 hypothetical protein [Aurantimonas sp. C2-6-R+9]MEC5410398.1 hypothetical protein [Aurantimonas sp. C2-4-R8]
MSRPFNSAALPKCHDRLSKVKRSLQGCRSASDFEQFASHWSEFLIHSGGVLNILDAGADTTPQGRQWYGGVKREGRNDPLLQYMHQARNVEEHAVEPTAEYQHPSLGIGGPGEDVYFDKFTLDTAFLKNPEKEIVGRAWRPSDGKPPTITRTPGGPKLLPARDDRFKNTYPPPTEHLGKPLASDDPLAVAELYLAYLERLVEKAGELS